LPAAKNEFAGGLEIFLIIQSIGGNESLIGFGLFFSFCFVIEPRRPFFISA